MKSSDDLKLYAKDLGKKLGFLVASLKTDMETKEAVLELAKDMDLEQIEKFLDILETRFLNESTGFVEEKLIQELDALKAETVAKKEKLYQETIKRLDI